MNVIDTSFLVGLFMVNDPHHSKAREMMIAMLDNNESLTVSNLVAQEFITVTKLKSSQNTEKIIEFLKSVVKSGESGFRYHFVTQNEFMAVLSESAERKYRKLSFVDLSLLVLANRLGAKIISFDSEIMKLAHSR